MAIKITDDCINCGACEPECPNTAIYEGGAKWKLSEGTKLKGTVHMDGQAFDAEATNNPLSEEIYFIIPNKCTECVGFHDEPQCAAVCPVDCCVPDDEHVESKEILAERQNFLHPH